MQIKAMLEKTKRNIEAKKRSMLAQQQGMAVRVVAFSVCRRHVCTCTCMCASKPPLKCVFVHVHCACVCLCSHACVHVSMCSFSLLQAPQMPVAPHPVAMSAPVAAGGAPVAGGGGGGGVADISRLKASVAARLAAMRQNVGGATPAPSLQMNLPPPVTGIATPIPGFTQPTMASLKVRTEWIACVCGVCSDCAVIVHTKQ